MGINVLKFVIWGGKSSVLWSQISFYEISDNLNFPDDNFKTVLPKFKIPHGRRSSGSIVKPLKIAVIILNFKQGVLFRSEIHQKDVDGMANSVDPGQSAV